MSGLSSPRSPCGDLLAMFRLRDFVDIVGSDAALFGSWTSAARRAIRLQHFTPICCPRSATHRWTDRRLLADLHHRACAARCAWAHDELPLSPYTMSSGSRDRSSCIQSSAIFVNCFRRSPMSHIGGKLLNQPASKCPSLVLLILWM